MRCPFSSIELEWNACVMVTSNSPTFCVPPLPMGRVSSSKPLLSIQRHVSKIATICGLCCFANASKSPKWSEWACERKITSSRGTFFSASGHLGLVITHGSISATWPDRVVSENVLWPKYVSLLPLLSSMWHLGRQAVGVKRKVTSAAARRPLPEASHESPPQTFLGCRHPGSVRPDVRLWSRK